MYSKYASDESLKCFYSQNPCRFHRYNTIYICGCGKLISHSQGDWDEHRLHPNGINIPSLLYNHGDSAKTLFERLHVLGCLPYFEPNFQKIWEIVLG